jgi:hypothetical protein
MMTGIAVVGTGGGAVNLSDLLDAADDCCDLVLVNVDDTPWTESDRSALDGVVRSVDGAGLQLDEICRQLTAHGVEGIVTFRDEVVPTAAAIAARMGLNYHSEATARAVTHKDVQRRLLAEAGIAQPRFATFTGAADLDAAVQEVGFPAVLKPVCGSGSTNVFPVEDLPQLQGALAEAEGSFPSGATRYQGRVGIASAAPWLLEQRLIGSGHPGAPWLGDYVSVETLTLGSGDHWHFWVTDRLPLTPPFREGGAGGPSQLPEHLREEVCDLVARGLDAVGVRTGISHTEVKLTADGPQIIEINGRLGGMIATLVGRAADLDVVRLALQSALGTARRTPVPADGYSFVLFGQPPASATRIRKLLPPAELRQVDGVWRVDVHATAGTPVDPRTGIVGRLRTVWLTGAASEEVRDACGRVGELVDAGDEYEFDGLSEGR